MYIVYSIIVSRLSLKQKYYSLAGGYPRFSIIKQKTFTNLTNLTTHPKKYNLKNKSDERKRQLNNITY